MRDILILKVRGRGLRRSRPYSINVGLVVKQMCIVKRESGTVVCDCGLGHSGLVLSIMNLWKKV